MNLATVYQHIAEAEEMFDVQGIRLADVNVWLPARDLFIRPYFEHRLRTYRSLLRTTSHTDPLSWELLRHREFAFEAEVAYEHRHLGDLVLFNKHGRQYGERYEEPVDLLVHHAFTDYGEQVGGRAFNRVNDGIVELAPDRDRVVKLLRSNPTAPLLPYYNPTHFYHELDQPCPFGEPDSGEAALLDQIEAIVAWARAQRIPHLYERQPFLHRLRTMLWRARNFQSVLRFFRPRSVFLSSYSNIERMAMIIACWREGIPAVDVEHGYMGPYSPYGRLGFVGPEGVRVLPRWFWCWGEDNQTFIERSLGSTRAHGALVGGSTWHRARDQLVAKGVLAERRPVRLPSTYIERLRDARRVVCFCWQPDMLVHSDPPSLLPTAFLEAASLAADDVLFCIRLHPRSHHLIDTFARLLHSVANWEIEYSTRYPLADILPYTDLLLTSYSTVAFEANALGIPVALADEFGVAMMGEYVRRGVFHARTEVDGLLDAFEHLSEAEVLTTEYMSADPDAHKKAFARILDGS